MLSNVDFYFFSPSGGTRKTGEILAGAIADQVRFLDLGKKEDLKAKPEAEVIVAALPVFGGRIPAVAGKKLQQLQGQGKKAVTLAVYGTRAYEDALLELNDLLEDCGFEILASGAFVAQHSMNPEIGAGRPDEKDAGEIRDFGKKILAKLEENQGQKVRVPGNHPYKPEFSLPVTPVSLAACNLCQTCAQVCPTEAIRMEKGAVVTDTEACCLCMACVYHCPEKVRILPPPMQEQMKNMLGALKGVRRENQVFL